MYARIYNDIYVVHVCNMYVMHYASFPHGVFTMELVIGNGGSGDALMYST